MHIVGDVNSDSEWNATVKRLLAVARVAEAHLLTVHRAYTRQDVDDLSRVVDAANLVIERAATCAACARLAQFEIRLAA